MGSVDESLVDPAGLLDAPGAVPEPEAFVVVPFAEGLPATLPGAVPVPLAPPLLEMVEEPVGWETSEFSSPPQPSTRPAVSAKSVPEVSLSRVFMAAHASTQHVGYGRYCVRAC